MAARCIYRQFFLCPRVSVFCLSLLLFALLPVSLSAEKVAVGRDGTLIFQSPSADSAVLDILPRGETMELVDRGEQWSEVLLDDSSSGFIRTEDIRSPAEITTGSREEVTTQSSSLYGILQGELTKSDEKIRRIELAIDQLEQMVAMYAQTDSTRALSENAGRGKVTGAGASSSGKFGFLVFSGLYFEEKELTAGLAASWFPEALKGLGLELEGGYHAMKNDLQGGTFNLNLLYPLGREDSRIRPYLSAGGGIFYTSGSNERDSNMDTAANLGLGALCPLSHGVNLRLDTRLFVRFMDGEQKSDGRFYLALQSFL
ncbi:hypothetical protein ACFL5K_03475 [Gemmatimonadota bacterium]